MKKKTIKISSLDTHVLVFIGSFDECDKVLSKYGEYSIDGSAALALEVVYDCDWECVLIFDEEQITNETIWHESLHSAFKVLHRKNIDTDYKQQESLAYLQGYIATEILKIVLNK